MAETMPLVEFYSEKGNLLTIDATDNVGEVYSRVKSSVESL
jgi:adenylate kinase family enzyme